VKYVNRIERADGSVQLYLRKRGLPAVRLPDGLSTPALQRHIAGLIEDLAPQGGKTAGTLGAALRAYELEASEFRSLAESTKYEYRLILKEFEQDLGGLPIASFTPAYVDRLKTAWARRGHRAANIRLQVLKNVLRPLIVSGAIGTDPFRLVAQVRRPRALAEPHRIWSDQVLKTVIEAAAARQRFGLVRAIAIARYTGARRGDLVAISRSARKGGRFRFISGKRKVRVDVPEDPLLTGWLDGTPDEPPEIPRAGRKLSAGGRAPSPTTLVYNIAGRPYTEDGLGQELAKLVRSLYAAGALDSDRYDLHGLRHTCGVELALAGCSDAEGAAMMGHSSPHSFSQYRRQADRSRLSDTAAARLAALREQA
jgi:integrase